jgi:NAD(P)-dependent dehydrogenase (short-subunit alcohol dehydrogenase family)
VSEISYEGRVAVVTGAGGGLGRSHALLLASRGARVVVNDLGGSRDGTGGGSEMADQVVQEITDAGGEAVANYDGVHTWEGGQAIVRTAVDTWGRCDIVVNNAGILRDVTFAKMEQEQMDLVIKVHLYGGFHVTRAAWPHMREQQYGRVVNTTSGSGLYGNFGQSNYSAAKLGLVGLTRTLALEGAKYGINANVIAPVAASRMTEDIMPPQLLEQLQPENVSPLVGYLASEACTDTGRIFSVGGGYVARVAIVEGPGATFDAGFTPEDVADRWSAITDVPLGEGDAEFTTGVMEQTGKIVQALGIELPEG